MRTLPLAVLLLAGPALAQPEAVPLDRALEIARDQSVAVLRARVGVERARASTAVASARRWPTLDLRAGGGQRYGLAFDQTAGALTQSTIESVDVGLDAGYTVYDGGARAADLRAAEADLRAAELDRERAAQQATAVVVEGYLAVAQAEARRSVATQTLAAERELLDAVRVRVEVGERAASEVAVQQERVAAAQGEVLAAEQDQRLAEARLVRVLGLDPTGGYAFPTPPPAAATVPASADALVERALASRADLRAVDATVRAAEAQRRAARAGRLPSVAVGAFVGTSYSSSTGTALPGQFGDNRGGSLRLSVSLPVLDGGRTAARVRQAEVQTLAAEVAAEDARRAVALEVRERRVALDAVGSRTEVAEVRVAAARTALDAEQARYLAGETTLQDVTQLRTRLVEAETELARLGVEARFASLLLDVAVGRPDSARGS